MANIQGEYTLAEVAAKLEVSPAWVNKMRGSTGIGGELGVQGKKTNFTDQDLHELRIARLLRLLEFDYDDIKKIYDIENELLKTFSYTYAGANLMVAGVLGLIIHGGKIMATKDVVEKDERLMRLYKQYGEILNKVFVRFKKIMDDYEKVAEQLKQDLVVYEELKSKLFPK